MKRKDYIYIGAYVLFFGFFITTLVEELTYQDEQFKKINKLNNDLIKLSQVLTKQQRDIEYLDVKIADSSMELKEIKRELTKTQNSANSFYQMFFDTQPQRIEKLSQGAETTPPPPVAEERVVPSISTLSSSEVSAPPPETISTPVERERVAITKTPNKVIASCPRPRQNLGKYITNIDLRKNYSFVIQYDVEDKEIKNITFTKNLPVKLQLAMKRYLNSFSLTEDKQGCKLPIKLLSR